MYTLNDEITQLLNAPVRDKTDVIVSVGQFDNSGDVSADSSAVASYGSPGNAIKDTDISVSYSAWVGNGLRGDGRQRILASGMLYEQGFVSADISDDTGEFAAPPYVEFDFTELRTLGGITLTFDDIAMDYPAQITVYAYLNGAISTQTTFAGMTPVFVAEIFATGVDGIKITFDKTREPNQNVKLSNILFGVGYEFGINDIMSYTLEESCDPISMRYPSLKFSFSVKNIDGFFSPSVSQNRMQFFSQNQTASARFWILDWIKGPTAWWTFTIASLKLDTWAVNGLEAKFTAISQMEQIKDMKLSKQQYVADRSIWGRLNDIKSDIGISDAIYGAADIDNIVCETPLSSGTPVSEAFQLLANYGGYCLLYDRLSGLLFFDRRRSTSDFAIDSASQAAAGYSAISDVGPSAINEYTTWEREFFRGDGTQLILPDAAPYLNNGFVSSGVVMNGTETLEIVYSAVSALGQTVNSIAVDFGSVVPEVMEIWSNAEPPGLTAKWSLRATRYPTKDKQSFGVSIAGAYQYKLVLKNGPNNTMLGRRYHVRNVTSSFAENFTLSRDKIFYPTKFTSKADYGSISTEINDILYENEIEEIGSMKISSVGVFYIKITPAMNKTVTYAGGNGSEVGSVFQTQYWDYVRITVNSMGTNTGELVFTVKGQKVYYSETPQSLTISQTGVDYHFENPLYDSSASDRIMDYAEIYAKSQIIEEIECMAHPELEIGDYINLYDGTIGFIAKRVMKDGRDKFTIMRGTYDGMAST